MPWKASRIVDQRLQFLSSYQKEEMSVSELCREFGVSRPTGYRWINRYQERGSIFGMLRLVSLTRKRFASVRSGHAMNGCSKSISDKSVLRSGGLDL
jgi:transposase-like protein